MYILAVFIDIKPAKSLTSGNLSTDTVHCMIVIIAHVMMLYYTHIMFSHEQYQIPKQKKRRKKKKNQIAADESLSLAISQMYTGCEYSVSDRVVREWPVVH